MQKCNARYCPPPIKVGILEFSIIIIIIILYKHIYYKAFKPILIWKLNSKMVWFLRIYLELLPPFRNFLGIFSLNPNSNPTKRLQISVGFFIIPIDFK